MVEAPGFDIAHLGHVELFTPRLEESRWFFGEVLDMEEVAHDGQSVYLRCSDLYERVSLIVTSNLRFQEWTTIFGNDLRLHHMSVADLPDLAARPC
jgi:catechol 2,3-dioxygenase-like lactoylglutathione lyase family enzyme